MSRQAGESRYIDCSCFHHSIFGGQVDTLVDVPEETCDLNPQKTCRLVTKLVPSLRPKQECTTVPQETCSLKFTQPQRKEKPLRTEWCLDEEAAAAAPQPTYTSG